MRNIVLQFIIFIITAAIYTTPLQPRRRGHN